MNGVIFMVKTAVVFMLLMISGQIGALAQEGEAHVRPILRLEKPKYLVGESIRFWVGVEPVGSREIPKEYQKPCSLSITKPDGTIQIQSVEWPVDGSLNSGWRGGSGFGDEEVEAGSYTLVLQCSKTKSSPVQLIVERNEVLDQVKAELRFDRSGSINMEESVPVVLSVENNSPYTIQFPKRGAAMEGVSVRVKRSEPAYRADLFYPWEKLSSSPTNPDSYTWSVASRVPSIVLKSGEHFEQRFTLEEAYRFDQPGNYEVEFSTVLSLLVGEKDGVFSKFCPIRLPVIASEKFVVSKAK